MSDKDFVVKNGLVVGSTATIKGVEIDPSGATENQVLKFDGTKFVPGTSGEAGALGLTYAATIGNGESTEYTVTHNLNTRDVIAVVRSAAPPYDQIDVRWEATTVNTLKIDFSSPPSNESVRIVVYAAVAGNILTTTNTTATPPENPTVGDLWFDSESAGMFVFYDSQWIEIGGSSSGARLFVSPTEPSGTAEGILWFNSNTAQVFVRYDSQWIEVGGSASSIDVQNAELNDVLKFDGTKFVATSEAIFNENILLINNGTDSTPINNAGIEVERGNSNNVLIRWNESNDVWEFTNNGSSYQELGRSTATISSTAPASPSEGQIWFDSSEGGTYLYYDSNWVEVGVTAGGSGGSGATITVDSTPPESPDEGALWFDSNTAQTFIYYDSSWVDISSSGNAAKVTVSTTAPSSPVEGEMWFDSDDARTYTYYDGAWVELGASGFTAFVNDSPPSNPVLGQIWYRSDTGGTYVYYGSSWVEIGAPSINAILAAFEAKGDLAVATSSGNIGTLSVGTNGQILTANSSTATGLEWQTPTYASTGKAIAMAIVFGG